MRETPALLLDAVHRDLLVRAPDETFTHDDLMRFPGFRSGAVKEANRLIDELERRGEGAALNLSLAFRLREYGADIPGETALSSLLGRLNFSENTPQRWLELYRDETFTPGEKVVIATSLSSLNPYGIERPILTLDQLRLSSFNSIAGRKGVGDRRATLMFIAFDQHRPLRT